MEGSNPSLALGVLLLVTSHVSSLTIVGDATATNDVMQPQKCVMNDGTEILVGQDKLFAAEQSCTIFRCTQTGLAEIFAECEAPRCVEPARKPGACCLSCPGGNNCLLPSGDLLEDGDIFMNDTTRCACPTKTTRLGWGEDLTNAICSPLTATNNEDLSTTPEPEIDETHVATTSVPIPEPAPVKKVHLVQLSGPGLLKLILSKLFMSFPGSHRRPHHPHHRPHHRRPHHWHGDQTKDDGSLTDEKKAGGVDSDMGIDNGEDNEMTDDAGNAGVEQGKWGGKWEGKDGKWSGKHGNWHGKWDRKDGKWEGKDRKWEGKDEKWERKDGKWDGKHGNWHGKWHKKWHGEGKENKEDWHKKWHAKHGMDHKGELGEQEQEQDVTEQENDQGNTDWKTGEYGKRYGGWRHRNYGSKYGTKDERYGLEQENEELKDAELMTGETWNQEGAYPKKKNCPFKGQRGGMMRGRMGFS